MRVTVVFVGTQTTVDAVGYHRTDTHLVIEPAPGTTIEPIPLEYVVTVKTTNDTLTVDDSALVAKLALLHSAICANPGRPFGEWRITTKLPEWELRALCDRLADRGNIDAELYAGKGPDKILVATERK